MTTQMRLL